jgi:hypothetical protein
VSLMADRANRMPEPHAARAYDVFNGDADGICALHQLRLARPLSAALVTGVKRDISLLERVPRSAGIDVTVLDISLDANHAALVDLLDAGARVVYFDHHAASHAFAHTQLRFVWDDSPNVCTSLIVDRELGGRFRRWAIAAAFGDNLDGVARRLAADDGCTAKETDALETLGRILNYNAYGETLADLHIPPDRLYRELHPYDDPLAFIADADCYKALAAGYRADLARVASVEPYWRCEGASVYMLPDAGWARRISGVLANRLTQCEPGCSFAVLTECASGAYGVSVRSGDARARPANVLCERFASGGGRRAAAGINRLPADQIEAFLAAFRSYFTGTDPSGRAQGPGPDPT